MAEQNETEVNGAAVVETALIYGTIFMIGFIVFEMLRNKMDRNAYYTRDRKTETKTPFVEKTYGFLGWVAPTLACSDEELMEYCGLDTLIYIRFQKLCLKIAGLGIALSVILLPVYYTGSAGDGKGFHFLQRFSMSNLEDNDARLYASILASFVTTLGTLYFLKVEYLNYIERRHEYLQAPNAHQYSVLINDLPKHLRSNQALVRYMKHLFPNSVRCAYVALEIKELEEYVKERVKVRDNLEYYLAVGHKTGNRPTCKVDKKLMCCGGTSQDAIDYYQDKLDDLNSKVKSIIDQVESRQRARSKELLAPVECIEVGSTKQKQQSVDMDQEDVYVEITDDKHETPNSPMSNDEEDKDESLVRSSAFVSFTTLQACQMAQQVLQSKKPYEMLVVFAPAVEDVEWSNVGMSYKEKSRWQLSSAIVTFLIVFFWTIPTTLVGSISQPESLKEHLSFLGDSGAVNFVLGQIAPLALVVMSALAKIIFKFVAKREGHASEAEINVSVFTKLCYFQLIQIFFVSVVSTALVAKLREIIEQPTSIASFLADSIPNKSNFFMQYIMVQFALGGITELLRIVPLIIAFIHRKFAPQLTKRQRESKWLILNPLVCPEQFEQPKTLAENYLILFLIIVYAPIAPGVVFFAAAYFFVFDIVIRRQVLFVHDPSPNSHGAYWPTLFRFVIIALIVGQITIIGTLSLKKSPAALVVLLLPFATLIFQSHINQDMPQTASFLPLNECCRLDRVRSKRSEDGWQFLDDAYSQPAMEEKDPVLPYIPGTEESGPVLESPTRKELCPMLSSEGS